MKHTFCIVIALLLLFSGSVSGQSKSEKLSGKAWKALFACEEKK